MSNVDNIKLDKTAWSVVNLNDYSDKAFWLGCKPEKRLEAMELMRQVNYGYDPTTTRLQRIFEVAER